MVNQPNLQIPAVINPEKTRCIQIEIPDDETWITNFVNLLAIPRFWFNWERTGDDTGKQLADVWFTLFNKIDWSNMSCCCEGQQPVIFRWGDGDVYQMSTDGGTTWTDAPSYAYQNTSTQWPNPNDLGISTSKCQAADGVVHALKAQVIEDLTDSMTAAEILIAIATVILAFASAGSLVLIEAQVTAISGAILAAGVSAVQAAFTDTVWDDFRCMVYCHMNTDSSIDAAGITALLSDITMGAFTGVVEPILYSLVQATGAIPMTNMMRSGAGSVDADCSACCPVCGADWTIVSFDGHDVGTIIDRGADYVTVQLTSHPDFGTPWNAMIESTGDDSCCIIDDIEFLTGDGVAEVYFGVKCGNPRWPGTSNSFFVLTTDNMNTVYIRKDSGSTATAKITFHTT